jgi:hypothetical protein
MVDSEGNTMWQSNTAMLEDIDAADRRPRLAIGDTVGTRVGTFDPDFPDIELNGWIGTIIKRDDTIATARCLVRWDERTVRQMSPDCREWCDMEDAAIDEMWLFEDDLDAVTV